MKANTEVMENRYPAALGFYHPNAAGQGAALRLEPRFSNRQGDRYNCFFLEMAAQQSAARGTGGGRTQARFAWEQKIAVKLDFADICELLVVLEGRAEKVGGSRGSLYHQSGTGNTVISCQRGDQGGYMLGLSRKDTETGQTRRVHIILGEAEAVGVRHVLQTSLFFLSFHQHLFGLWAGRPE